MVGGTGEAGIKSRCHVCFISLGHGKRRNVFKVNGRGQ